MDWYQPNDYGAFGRWDDTGDARCPICYVPPGAPHLNSCDDTGVWRGEDSADGSHRAEEWDG